jgi:hypothetical protein
MHDRLMKMYINAAEFNEKEHPDLPDGLRKLLNVEKFSEYIIEECSRVAAATPCPYTDAGEEANHAWDMACHEAAKRIREHFRDE